MHTMLRINRLLVIATLALVGLLMSWILLRRTVGSGHVVVRFRATVVDDVDKEHCKEAFEPITMLVSYPLGDDANVLASSELGAGVVECVAQVPAGFDHSFFGETLYVDPMVTLSLVDAMGESMNFNGESLGVMRFRTKEPREVHVHFDVTDCKTVEARLVD